MSEPSETAVELAKCVCHCFSPSAFQAEIFYPRIATWIDAALHQERETCAKICEAHASVNAHESTLLYVNAVLETAAADIRARNKKENS